VVSEIIRPRIYQAEAIDALIRGWDDGKRRLAVVLPTGAGKTIVFAHLAKTIAHTINEGKSIDAPGPRVLVLAHTDELVRQAHDKIGRVWPECRRGIVKATQNETWADVVIASVQSLRSEQRRAMIRNVGLIIVDECHHAAASTYQEVLKHYGCFEPDGALCAGFTATLSRGDKKALRDTWEDVAYKKDISFMIRSGYLVNVRGKRIEIADLDLKNVKRSGGDFQDGSLGMALTDCLAPEIVAKAIRDHASDRQGIAFTPTVASAYEFATEMRNQGIAVDTIHGGLNRDERRRLIKKFQHGDIQYLTNCMVLTEGFDAPATKCIVVARPTRVAGLYQQMVGRGLRPDPLRSRTEQQDCLVLDVVGASAVHGLATLVDLSEKPVTYADDVSLTDLEDQEDEGADHPVPDLTPRFHGRTRVIDFDPVGAHSKYAWMRTTGGRPFLSVGRHATGMFIFLRESAAGEFGYDVAWCMKDCQAMHVDAQMNAGVTPYVGVTLEEGVAWCEDLVQHVTDGVFSNSDTNTYSKTASWRKGNAEPSDSQLQYAKRLRVQVPDGATKSEVSILIDTAVASRRIDPLID
jgi:superfamily II DNA or RNA helicase